jgi:hypothetical protein
MDQERIAKEAAKAKAAEELRRTLGALMGKRGFDFVTRADAIVVVEHKDDGSAKLAFLKDRHSALCRFGYDNVRLVSPDYQDLKVVPTFGTVEMLNALQQVGLHEIAFRNAGVGLQFFIPAVWEEKTRRVWDEVYRETGMPDDWRQGLVVDRYYETFEEAVEAEYRRMFGEN